MAGLLNTNTDFEARMQAMRDRRAAGNANPNPFKGLLDFIVNAENPNSDFQTQGLSDSTLTGDIPSPLTSDQSIYGNLGVTEPAPLPTFQQPSDPVQPQPTQEVAADVKELPGTIAAIEQADATPKQKTDAKAKVTSETSVAMVDEAKADMAASGATPEQLSQFDKFAGEYDIATIGMALLASNDGTGTFSANLGKAMLLGKQAKTKQQERADAKADKVTKAEAASRKEARDERKVKVAEAAQKATDWYQKARINVAANGSKGLAGIGLPTAAELAVMKPLLDEKIAEGGGGAEMDEADMTRLAMAYKKALDLAPPGTSPTQVMDDVFGRTVGIVDEFSYGPTYTNNPSRLNQQ